MDSALYAHRIIDKVIECTELISQNPRIGRKVPEFDRKDIREMFIYSYRIIYLLKEDEVQIISVIHGARLLPDEL